MIQQVQTLTRYTLQDIYNAFVMRQIIEGFYIYEMAIACPDRFSIFAENNLSSIKLVHAATGAEISLNSNNQWEIRYEHSS